MMRIFKSLFLWTIFITTTSSIANAGEPQVIDWFANGDVGGPQRIHPGKANFPWKSINRGSVMCSKFGITDGPVNISYGTGLLADGRPAVVFEHWERVGKAMDLQLHVWALTRGKWEIIGSPISLSPNAQPIPFNGQSVNWANGKAFWFGSPKVKWGKQLFWFGGYYVAEKLALNSLKDGRLQITMLMKIPQGSNVARIKTWVLKDKKWTAHQNTSFQLPGRSAGQPNQLVVDASGNILTSTLRSVQILNQDQRPTYKNVITIHHWDGNQWQERSINQDTFKMKTHPNQHQAWLMNEEAFIAFTTIRDFRKAIEPVTYLLKHDAPTSTWTPLLNAKEAPGLKKYGMPQAFTPDGKPIWLWYKNKNPRQVFTGHPHYVAWDKETNQYIESPLPDFKKQRFTDVWGAPSIQFQNGQVYIAVRGASRHLRANGVPIPQGHALHTAVWVGNGKDWQFAGKKNSPAFTRPFHGGHDGIGDIALAVGNDGTCLLLWHGCIPIHGPEVLYGAWWSGKP